MAIGNVGNAFVSNEATAGNPTSVTLPAMPGKRYRVVFCDVSSAGGTGTTPVSVTGVDDRRVGVALDYKIDLPVDQVVNVARGLESKENTAFVFTIAGLASSVPKISILAEVIRA